jgi:hypothetical protein
MKKDGSKGPRLTGMGNELGHVSEQKNQDVEAVTLRTLRPGSNPGGASARTMLTNRHTLHKPR